MAETTEQTKNANQSPSGIPPETAGQRLTMWFMSIVYSTGLTLAIIGYGVNHKIKLETAKANEFRPVHALIDSSNALADRAYVLVTAKKYGKTEDSAANNMLTNASRLADSAAKELKSDKYGDSNYGISWTRCAISRLEADNARKKAFEYGQLQTGRSSRLPQKTAHRQRF